MATTYRPSPEAQAALEHLTQRTGLSAQKILDQAVIRMDGGDERSARVRAAFEDGLVEWADVLERLRTA